MTPIWKSGAFWTMIVAAIAQILLGLRYTVEAQLFTTAAGTVIAYFVYLGWITSADIKAQASLKQAQMANDLARELKAAK
jgi:membrane-anchored protein YejM (alkaline phosphatase superfamily)